MTSAYGEHRRSPRLRRSDPLYWRVTPLSEFRMGWLLESSDDGLAFAWRGETLPAAGTLLEVRVGEPQAANPSRRAVVRHAAAAHEDLNVLGVELQYTRGFPPQTRSLSRAAVVVRPAPPLKLADTEIASSDPLVAAGVTE